MEPVTAFHKVLKYTGYVLIGLLALLLLLWPISLMFTPK